jgi:hypothetical protein
MIFLVLGDLLSLMDGSLSEAIGVEVDELMSLGIHKQMSGLLHWIPLM